MLLNDIRKEIDKVDNEIKLLFEERMKLADEVARIKSETLDDILKPNREAQIIENLTNGVDSSISMEYEAFIKKTMTLSRMYQYNKTLKLRKDEIEKLNDLSDKLMAKDYHNRIEILFSINDKAGSIGSILSMVGDYKVNIKDIRLSTDKEYNFFMVIEGNLLENNVKSLMYQLSKETNSMEIVKSYKE